MNNKHIEQMVTRDPSWPCMIEAVFRWCGTDSDCCHHFNSEASFREFKEKQADRLELRDYFYYKARYIQDVDRPKVIDYNDGYHTQGAIDAAAKILGYCTAKAYQAPYECLSRQAQRELQEREAWDRYYSKHKNQ